MSSIHVTIDRLVLRGIDGAERYALVAALRSELSRVLADPATRGQWAMSHRTPVLKLGRMPLQSGPAGAATFGSGLARAIGRGMRS
jgi:hypothetical protein